MDKTRFHPISNSCSVAITQVSAVYQNMPSTQAGSRPAALDWCAASPMSNRGQLGGRKFGKTQFIRLLSSMAGAKRVVWNPMVGPHLQLSTVGNHFVIPEGEAQRDQLTAIFETSRHCEAVAVIVRQANMASRQGT